MKAFLAKLAQSTTGMKFIAFVIVVVAAMWSIQDDTECALLIGAAYATLCGANTAISRRAIAAGQPTS